MKNTKLYVIGIVLILSIAFACTMTVFATGDDLEILPHYEIGDVNLDEDINIKDATEIQKYAASLITLADVQLLLADIDDNSNVNIKDATYIQKLIAGLIESSTPDENKPQRGDKPVFLPSVSATEDEPATEPDDDKPIILPVIPAA